MLRQEAFDKVLTKIVEQGYPSTNGSGSCRMNGRHGGHCAIGWLLDEETRKRIDNLNAGILRAIDDKIAPTYMIQDREFYLRLQEAHDSSPAEQFIPAFLIAMRRIAADFRLEYKEPVSRR